MGRLIGVFCVLLSIGLCGCVERKLTITSKPAGALVYVSDVEVGRTPVTIPFTWYGDYDIIYRMEGYETVKTHAGIGPPWYEIPPIDLFSAMAPWTYRDHRYLSQELHRLELPSEDTLIRRAEDMQKRNMEPVSK